MVNNYLIFGGVKSSDYGIYISGEGVFDAPKRDTEMISIPGRNGAFALDHGRFENITVTYPAHCYEETYELFTATIDSFRNAITAKTGYQQLTDTFHPDEFRMGAFISGLEVDPILYNSGAKFNITFECKPQRYLMSGQQKFIVGDWGETEVKTGDVITFDNTSGIMAVKSAEVALVPHQDTSGGQPSPSNPCPITGASDVKICVRGHNVWDEEWRTGFYNGSTGAYTSNANYICNKNDIPVLPNTSYYMNVPSGNGWAVFYYEANGTFISRTGLYTSVPLEITTPANCRILRFYCNTDYGTTYNNDISINYPSTFTTYEPYEGNTTTSSLGTTVYGGSVDVVAGSGEKTWASVDMGSLSWVTYGGFSNGFAAHVTGKKHALGSFICSDFAYWSGTYPTIPNGYMKDEATTDYVYVHDSRYSDAATFKTAMSGVQLVYELATPTTISPTPTTIDTIQGVNYVWSPQGTLTLEIGDDPDFIVNPTLFGCGPLIEAKGYGDITFNGHTISLANGAIGTVHLWNRTSNSSLNSSITKQFTTGMFNTTDTFSFRVSHMFTLYEDNPSITNTNANAVNDFRDNNDGSVTYWIDLPCTFTVGTTGQITNESTYTFFGSKKVIANMTVSYDKTTGTVTYTVATSTVNNPDFASMSLSGITLDECSANSTLNRLGNPTYIDCDLGETYKIENGEIVGLNSFVDLGSDLPTLASGPNEVTYDNTFTEVAVTPRYWTV